MKKYFKKVSRPAKKKNIIQLVDQLKAPQIEKNADLKKLYYEDQKNKYGF
jgi:hypothetical protein